MSIRQKLQKIFHRNENFWNFCWIFSLFDCNLLLLLECRVQVQVLELILDRFLLLLLLWLVVFVAVQDGLVVGLFLLEFSDVQMWVDDLRDWFDFSAQFLFDFVQCESEYRI
jgi:hypothetical protein